MSKLQEKLNELSKGHTSNWSEKAQWRQQNRKWLRYSGNIALRVLAALEDKDGMNQKTLAEQIGVSPQYISKLLKGQENLSLETIAKLSEALGIELISFPEYKYSKPVQSKLFVPVQKPTLKVAYRAQINREQLQEASTLPCIAEIA